MKTNRLKTALHPKAISGRITGISQNNRSRHQAGPFISTLYENQLYSGNAQKPLFPAVCTYKHRHLPELWQIPDPLLLLRYLPHCLFVISMPFSLYTGRKLSTQSACFSISGLLRISLPSTMYSASSASSFFSLDAALPVPLLRSDRYFLS